MATLDEIQSVIDGKRYGDYIAANCLWHDDSHPSLLIYEDGFYCLGCGKRGTIKELFTTLGHFTDFELKSRFSKNGDFRNPFNKWLREKSVQEFCWDAHRTLTRNPSQGIYLRKRGIEYLIGELKLGWVGGYYIFPVYDKRNQIIGAIARAGEAAQEETDMRYMTPHGQVPCLYAPDWQMVEKQSVVRVPFGIIDCITIYSLGLAAVTYTHGKRIPSEMFDSLRKRIVILPDSGEEKEANLLAADLGWRGSVKRLDYPLDCKDSNDVFCKHGSPMLMSLIGDTVSWSLSV